METLNDEEVVLNLKLLKAIYLYHILDPSTIKIYNCNVYLVPIFILTAVTQLGTIFGMVGLFADEVYWFSYVNYFIVVFIIIHYYLVAFMVFSIIKKREMIWDLFPVTKFNFLTSKMCVQNIKTLYTYRTKTVQITNIYAGLVIIVCVQWILSPLVLNSFRRNENAHNLRMENILNFPYPIKSQTYNQYYVFFYIIEVLISYMIIHNVIIVDGILISFYYALIGQYKVIVQSFQIVGLEEKAPIEYYSDLKSILVDLQKLNWNLKLFYSVVRPIILTNVAINFILIVMITYSLISVCLAMKSFSIFDVAKLLTTVLYEYSHAFVLCFIFENIYNEVNSVNYAIYSCNWTKMNLKFKKLLLFAMRMNATNKPVIKFSLTKVVNLQLFASVVMTSYNIVSVLVNTINNKDVL